MTDCRYCGHALCGEGADHAARLCQDCAPYKVLCDCGHAEERRAVRYDEGLGETCCAACQQLVHYPMDRAEVMNLLGSLAVAEATAKTPDFDAAHHAADFALQMSGRLEAAE